MDQPGDVHKNDDVAIDEGQAEDLPPAGPPGAAAETDA